MKTIFLKTLVPLIVILIFSINLNANNNSVDYRRIKNRVSSFINYPKIDKEKNEVAVVFVDISINPEGKIIINEIYGNEGYKEYVIT